MKKSKLYSMLRTGIALLLVCCMVVGYVPATVFAAEADDEGTKESINYVSLGDSMTNGYGLDGYNSNSGVLDYGYGSYTNQFAQWLVTAGYADEVNHFQLALSGMRAEDLHWLLEVDYEDQEVIELIDEMDRNYWNNKDGVINNAIAAGRLDEDYAAALKEESSKKAYFEAYADRWNEVFSNGDSWTWRELIHNYRFNVCAVYIKYYEENPNASTDISLKYEDEYGNAIYSDVEALKIVAKYFQDAVANADIVSNGIGNGNFGVFILGRIQEAIGFSGKPVEAMIYKVEAAIRECDPAIQAKILELKDLMYAQLEEYIHISDNEMMEAILNSVVYGGLSYLLNWCGSVDAIVELNPDAEIIIVGLMNTMNGIKMEIGGVTIDIGKCMGIMLDSLNAYMAGYPVVMQALGHYEDATFYYAEERQVECYADTYNSTIYTDGVVRDRFVKSIVGTESVDPEKPKENWGLIWNSIEPIAKSMGTDLQLITLEQIQAYEALSDADKIAYAMSDGKMAMSISLYLAAENAVLRVLAEGGVMSGDAAVALGNGTLTVDSVVALFKEKLDEYTPANTQRVIDAIGADTFNNLSDTEKKMLVALFAMPDALGDALAEDEAVGGLLNLWAHCLLGNGLSGHPSQGGHDQLAKAVIAAYESGHTAMDETLENVQKLIEELCKLVETYGPEVAAEVWQYWVDNGYVDAVEDAIAELEVTLKERYDYYYAQALPALEEALKNLEAQKVELQAQLVVLKAQLEAKKAELDELIKEQIGEANAAYQAAKAELEKAIAELENAIDNVEDMIEKIADEISAVAEMADQILAVVKELGATLDNLADAAANVKEVIENIGEILSNVDVDQILETLKAAKDNAAKVIEVLEISVDTAKKLANEVDALVAKMSKDIAAAYEMVINELSKCIDALPEEVKEVLAEAMDAIKVELEEAQKQVAAELEKKIAEAQEKFAEELAKLEAYYNALIEDKKAELEALNEKIVAEIQIKYAQLQELYNEKLAELEAKKAELEAELKAYQKELADLAADVAENVRKEIQNKIDEVNAKIEEVKAEIESIHAQLEAAYEQAVAEITAAYEKAVAEIEQKIAEIRAQLEQAIAEITAAYEQAVAELKAEAEKKIEELKIAAQEAIAALEVISAELREKLEAYIDELNEQIAAAEVVVKEIVIKAQAKADEIIAEAEKIAAIGSEKLDELVEQVVMTVKAMLYQATHADLVIDDEFKYVALGDGSAVADGYVEILAKYLNDGAVANGLKGIVYENNAKVNNTVADELKDLAALAQKVSGADLITLGYSNVTFLANALNGVIEETPIDWTTYVDAEYTTYIEQIIAAMQAELEETVGNAEVAAIATELINACAFGAIQYAIEMPMLVEAIHQINPEATVVIVGMYNPLAGVSIELGEDVIEIGDYVDYLVEAVAVHGLAYSMISNNAIYVDAREVETTNGSNVLNIRALMTMLNTGFKTLYPSVAANDYIAEQIAKALNISYVTPALWGDANGDGVVNTVDATLVLQYYTNAIDENGLNLAVCDVNGDGDVNSVDATLILQYYTNAIVSFPVEQ